MLATGQLYDAEPYRDIIVAYRDGAPVRLGQLGKVIDSVEEDKNAAWFVTSQGSIRAVVLAVQRQPGTNSVAVADAVKDVIPKLKAYLRRQCSSIYCTTAPLPSGNRCPR